MSKDSQQQSECRKEELDNDVSLGAKVAKAVIDEFNGLKIKSGKPVIRSNGVKEWTVIAGLVALVPQTIDYKVIPISISTGVKAMPEKCRNYSNGTIVHDMHAEILALRLFNWYLLNECTKFGDKDNQYKSIFIDKIDDGTYKWKQGIKLALYISEPPCGDASMSIVSESIKDNDPWENPPNKKAKIEGGNGVLRGRAHLDKLGIVRTKPGRADSLVSLSKSCSDKLCLRQLTGILNSMTNILFPHNIFLNYIVLKRQKVNTIDLDRCFYTRFANKLEHAQKLEILTYDSDCYEFHKPESSITTTPSPLSLIYVVPTKTLQVLNNGVTNGSYVKNKPPKKGRESFICNQSLFQIFKQIFQKNSFNTYNDIKTSSAERIALKSLGYKTLGNWPQTQEDDFKLHW